MFGKRFDLFEIFGFKIRLDISWFPVALLIAWSLATGQFPQSHPNLSQAVYWAMGVAGALGLFASVVLHELSHSLVARRFGLQMKGITLFLFGGVAEMSDEPPSPKAEFWVAIAGPIASVLIGLACWGLQQLAVSAGVAAPVEGVLGYLAVINLLLVAFNVIPAFPLDGGRVLRSILWQVKNSLRWATRVTSRIGSGFGMLLIFGGILLVFQGAWVGGMWFFLIGLFLRNAAQMSYQQLLLRKALEGEPVRRFMESQPVTVPRAASVRELVEDFIYKHHFKMFPVVDNGHLVGCVTTRDVKGLAPEEWERQSVGTIAEQCTEENTISPEEDAMEALGRMSRTGASRLLVVEGGELVGILALKDLVQFFSSKVELDDLS